MLGHKRRRTGGAVVVALVPQSEGSVMSQQVAFDVPELMQTPCSPQQPLPQQVPPIPQHPEVPGHVAPERDEHC